MELHKLIDPETKEVFSEQEMTAEDAGARNVNLKAIGASHRWVSEDTPPVISSPPGQFL